MSDRRVGCAGVGRGAAEGARQRGYVAGGSVGEQPPGFALRQQPRWREALELASELADLEAVQGDLRSCGTERRGRARLTASTACVR